MIRAFTLFLLLMVFATVSFSQSGHRCGTHQGDDFMIHLRQNKKFLKEYKTKSSVTRYVPVTFHLVADDDGNGRISLPDIYNQLCKLNLDYIPFDMVFYIQEIRYLNNSNAFHFPASYSGYLRGRKDGNAMNIFVTRVCDVQDNNPDNDDTVAGYYSGGQNDYVVMRKASITEAGSTLSHEAGHFFSLPHPHIGWDGDADDNPPTAYNPEFHGDTVTVQYVTSHQSGGARLVELMDGSNCEDAADEICDTPPDYGFGRGNCANPFTVYDRNGDLIITDPKNVMAYYFNCDTEHFTNDQMTLVQIDFDSPRRNYLRSSYVPVQDTIVADFDNVIPAQNSTVDTYNGVLLSWNSMEHVETYGIEIGTGSDKSYYETQDTFLYLTDLVQNKVYLWSMYPYNESYTCLNSIDATGGRFLFFTGDETTSTAEIEGLEEISIFPNPSSIGRVHIEMNATSKTNLIATLTDVSGRKVNRSEHNIQLGKNHISMSTEGLNAGIYFVTLSSDKGSYSHKLILE